MRLYGEMKRSLRSIFLHRLSAFLSTLGIVFGVIAVITMLSIGEGAKQETLEQIEQLGTNQLTIRQIAVSEEKKAEAIEKCSRGLTCEEGEILRQAIPEVSNHANLKIVEASLTGDLLQASPEIVAVTRTFGAIKGLQLSEGRFLCDRDQKEQQLVCVLGFDIAKRLGKHVGESIRLGLIPYEIVGILQSTKWKKSQNSVISTRNFNQIIFLPLGANSEGGVSEITLQLKEAAAIETGAKMVRQILDKRHGEYQDYQMIIPQELLEQAYRTQRTFNWVLGSIAGISLIVGGIGIMNIMLANISERTREIGIRRAVGATKRHILIQFLLETLLLTLLGAICGALIGIGVSALISWIAGWRTIVTLWSIGLALIMSLIVGICSGVYPAYLAATMNPVQALRDLS